MFQVEGLVSRFGFRLWAWLCRAVGVSKRLGLKGYHAGGFVPEWNTPPRYMV